MTKRLYRPNGDGNIFGRPIPWRTQTKYWGATLDDKLPSVSYITKMVSAKLYPFLNFNFTGKIFEKSPALPTIWISPRQNRYRTERLTTHRCHHSATFQEQRDGHIPGHRRYSTRNCLRASIFLLHSPAFDFEGRKVLLQENVRFVVSFVTKSNPGTVSSTDSSTHHTLALLPRTRHNNRALTRTAKVRKPRSNCAGILSLMRPSTLSVRK